MRSKVTFATLAAAVLFTVGCATQPAQLPGSTVVQLTPGEKEVMRVNREAWQKGIDVVWVRPPTQRYHDRKLKEELRAEARADSDDDNG